MKLNDDDLPPGYRWMRNETTGETHQPPMIVQRIFQGHDAETLKEQAWDDYFKRAKEI